MRRLFLAWRLTDSEDQLPAFVDLRERLRTQDTLKLKSNQDARMWPKLYWTNHRQKLVEFSKNIADEYLTDQVVKSGKDKGEVIRCVPAVLNSIFAPYIPYTPREESLYFPNRKFELLNADGVTHEVFDFEV